MLTVLLNLLEAYTSYSSIHVSQKRLLTFQAFEKNLLYTPKIDKNISFWIISHQLHPYYAQISLNNALIKLSRSLALRITTKERTNIWNNGL